VHTSCNWRHEAYIDSSEVTVDSAGVMVEVAAVIVVVAVLQEGLAAFPSVQRSGNRLTLESHW